MSWLFIALIIIGLFVIIYSILCFTDRRRIYQYWNENIAIQCNYQNETDRAFRNIPSLQSAWVCQNEYVRLIHRSIFLLHNDLLSRVEEYFKAMIECAEEGESDTISRKGGIRYFPFQINHEITSLVETFGLNHLKIPAFNFGLLIIEPGTTTPWRKSLSRGIYRYHYALKLPKDGEFGLYLRLREDKDQTRHLSDKMGSIGEDKSPLTITKQNSENISVHRIKWKDKQGFIWDASLEHHLGNYSSEPCFLLIADIPRQLSWKHHWINNLLHSYFSPSNSETSLDV